MWSWLKTKLKQAREVRLNSTRQYVITITEDQVSCARPNGLIESVTWDDLRAVLIETTDEGPFAADVFWLLIGEKSGCIIPQDAIGNEDLLERLQSLPGFDNEAVIRAMGSTRNERFMCWQKEGTAI